MADQPNIVLVHGAWADGSSWSAAIERLQAAGYRVTAPQFPLTKLADDVARLRRVLARQDGPTVLVGHSYGGQIVTASVKMRRMSSDWSTSLASRSTKGNQSQPCWDRDLRPRRSRTSTPTSKASPGCPKTTS
ncbi:MAG: alpha/beta hydrolase [Actinobacteria bacterium]|nr:MAG: alpha/beta hydrolase [Actinomycetota bacterium]